VLFAIFLVPHDHLNERCRSLLEVCQPRRVRKVHAELASILSTRAASLLKRPGSRGRLPGVIPPEGGRPRTAGPSLGHVATGLDDIQFERELSPPTSRWSAQA